MRNRTEVVWVIGQRNILWGPHCNVTLKRGGGVVDFVFSLPAFRSCSLIKCPLYCIRHVQRAWEETSPDSTSGNSGNHRKNSAAFLIELPAARNIFPEFRFPEVGAGNTQSFMSFPEMQGKEFPRLLGDLPSPRIESKTHSFVKQGSTPSSWCPQELSQSP